MREADLISRTIRIATLSAAMLILGAPACDSPTGVCTLIGCSSGLLVRLNALPTGPFQVDVFAGAPDVSPSYRYECVPGPSGCLQEIFFSGLVARHAFIRVTTDDGTALHEILDLHYETHRPNGPRCEPTCRTAETTVSIPTA